MHRIWCVICRKRFPLKFIYRLHRSTRGTNNMCTCSSESRPLRVTELSLVESRRRWTAIGRSADSVAAGRCRCCRCGCCCCCRHPLRRCSPRSRLPATAACSASAPARIRTPPSAWRVATLHSNTADNIDIS